MAWSPCVCALGVDGDAASPRDLLDRLSTTHLVLAGASATCDPMILSVVRLARLRGILTVALLPEQDGAHPDLAGDLLECFDSAILVAPASSHAIASSLADMVRAGAQAAPDVARLARVLAHAGPTASATRQGFGEACLGTTFDLALARLAEQVGPSGLGARRLLVNVTGGPPLGPDHLRRALPMLHARFPEVESLTLGFVCDPIVGEAHRVTLITPLPGDADRMAARSGVVAPRPVDGQTPEPRFLRPAKSTAGSNNGPWPGAGPGRGHAIVHRSA